MLRRTLVLFTALTLLGLAMVLVYAWLNVDSAKDAVDRAEAHLARGNVAEAVDLLIQAERSSGDADPQLLRRILRARYEAHDRLRNFKHAREDIERLLALGERSLELELSRVRILRGCGESELARTEALKLAEANPDSAPCLEAAGECVQFGYQADLKKLLETSLERMPTDDLRRAKQLMLVFLYRDVEDVESRRARAEFDELLRDKMPDQVKRAGLDLQMTKIAQGIAQSASLYRRALEAGPETAPAFRGLSRILIQQGRIDDAALFCEIYLRRFDTALAAYAAERGAALHIERGRPAEAVRIIKDWKRGRTCKEQFEVLDMNQEVELPAAIATWKRAAEAMWEQSLAGELRTLTGEFFGLQQHLFEKFRTWNLLLDDRYLNALAFLAEKNWGAAYTKLDEYVKTDTKLVQRTLDETDRFAQVMEWLHHAAKQAGARQELVEIANAWIRERDKDAKAYALRAADFEDAGNLSQARHDLHTCVVLEPGSEGYLAELLRVAERIHGRDGLGSKDLLQKLLRYQGTNMFKPGPDPVLFLGVAEEAISRGYAEIAVDNARQATQDFPRCPRPRRAYVRASLLAGHPKQAISELETLRAFCPPSTEDLELLLEARRKAQRPIADVVRDLLVEDSSLRHAPELMQKCRARGAHREVLAIGEKFLRAHGDHGGALLAMGDSERELGNPERALSLFARVAEGSPQRLEAVERSLYLRAKAGSSEECMLLAAELVRLARSSGEILVRAGTTLADLGAGQAALACLLPIAEEKRFAPLRSAKLLTKIAEIMLSATGEEACDRARAELLLEGAISMEDGGRAKVLLATLYATELRLPEADEVYSFPQVNTAPSIDVEAGLLIRLGRRPTALAVLDEALRIGPPDYATLALRALAAFSLEGGRPGFAKGKSTGIPDLDLLVLNHPLEMLDLLTLPRLAGFGDRIVRAEAVLLKVHGGNPWVSFFIARARELQGDWRNAIVFHSKALADHPRFFPAYDEVYRLQADHDPASLSQSSLVLEYVKLMLTGLPVLSPRMLSGAIQMGAVELAKGDPESARRLRLAAWLLDPRSFQVGRDLALEAFAEGRTGEALQLLDLVWDLVPDGERIAFQDLYFQAALAAVRQTEDASLRARTRTRAEKVLRDLGILGSAFHFLADINPAGMDSLSNESLTAHVRYLMDRGVSPSLDLPGIERSLDVLLSRSGPKTVLPLLDDLLAADPSVFDLWLLRARILDGEGRPKEAAKSLRWILEYLAHPAAARGYADVVAGADMVSAGDEDLVRDSVGAAPDRREDRAALALLAWRLGRHHDVVRLLGGPPAELRPIELYARAAALVAIGRKEELALAAEDLEELGRRGKSPHTQEAAFLARQLRSIR